MSNVIQQHQTNQETIAADEARSHLRVKKEGQLVQDAKSGPPTQVLEESAAALKVGVALQYLAWTQINL